MSYISLSSLSIILSHNSHRYHHQNKTTTAAPANPTTVQIPPLDLNAEAPFPAAAPPLLAPPLAEAEADGVGVKVVCWEATPVRESGREGVSEERVIMFVLLVLLLLLLLLLVLVLGEEMEAVVVVEELRLDWARPIWLWETGRRC